MNIKKALIICQLLFLFIANIYSQDFRFAVVTDIHLNATNQKPTEDLQRSVDQINSTDSIDFVLVTGDLTEEGDHANLLKAKNILDQLKTKYYIIPGNHETKWSESGMTDFANIFGGERFKFEHNGILFLGFNSGPLMRMAYGHVAPQDISWAKEEIEKAGKDKKVILVTHYPILEGDVDNWYEVTDAFRPYNIRLFIGGHYHKNKVFSYDGIPGILVRSNLRDDDGIGGYNIFDVRNDSIFIYEQRIGKPKRYLHSLSLQTQYYDKAGKAAKYPDYSVNQEYENVQSEWTLQTGVGIYSSPVLYKDKIYVGDDLGKLTCYAKVTGKACWSFNAGKRIIGTPAVSNNKVVFGSADHYIYGIDATTGKKVLKIKADAPVLGAVRIENNIAYIGASDHTFRAIDIRNGKIKWTYTDVKGYIETMPLITKDKVIFGAWDNTLYALSKQNGKVEWKWTGGLNRIHFSPAAVWPVAADNKVFIVDPQRAMTAIDIHNGETIWRTFQSQVRETIGLSADNKRVFAKTMNDSIVCYSATSNSPEKLWATNVGFGYEHSSSQIVEKDGLVFGSTKEGLIFALDSFNGTLIWKHKVGNSLINTVLPIGHNELLFTSTDGIMGLLKW